MADAPQENQVQAQEKSTQNDKEHNFRMLESKYERQLAQERAGRLEAERIAQEALNRNQQRQDVDDEDDSSEPYVDHKKLKKTLSRHNQQVKQETQSEIQKAVNQAIQSERKENWMRNNGDFYEVMEHAQKLYEKDQELAETILAMPESFERQKLVYKSIKSMGLHKPPEKQSTIQDKVDANRRSPGYQPSGVGTAPYASAGDFSPTGQKSAYEKMQALKKTLRI